MMQGGIVALSGQGHKGFKFNVSNGAQQKESQLVKETLLVTYPELKPDEYHAD